MPASINTIPFVTLKGQVQRAGLVVEDVTRPGVDGHAYRELARMGKPFEMIGMRDCLTFTTANAVYDALLLMQGTLVPVTDDYGAVFTGVMLLEVEKLELRPIRTPVGGVEAGSLAWLVVRFLMQVATVGS